MSANERIATLTLDENSLRARNAQLEHERAVAAGDLLHENYFSLTQAPCGPYDITLTVEEGRLVFDIQGQGGQGAGEGGKERVVLSVQPLKSLIRDYFLICESYYAALSEAMPHRLEAIDMGRRGVHNEGSEMLKSLLENKISVDFPTARRLFTLVAALHLK